MMPILNLAVSNGAILWALQLELS